MPGYPTEHMMQAQVDLLPTLETLEVELRLCAEKAAQARAAFVKLPLTSDRSGLPVKGYANHAMSTIARYWNIRFQANMHFLWTLTGGFQEADKWLETKGIERPHEGYMVP